MKIREINLHDYLEGVTLFLTFNTPLKKVTPFTIRIYGIENNVLYYKREVNKPKVTINLPVHTKKMLILWDSNFELKDVLITKLKPTKINYEFRKNIVQKRPYKISDIQKKWLPCITVPKQTEFGYTMIETDHPARFSPTYGIAEFSQRVMSRLPEPVVEFIQDHEEGHYYYGRPLPNPEQLKRLPFEEQKKCILQLKEDEEAADEYALYKMINKGYNFSGALTSLTDYLPGSYINDSRMKNITNTINHIHKKYFNGYAD